MKILLAIPAYRCPKQIRRVIDQLSIDTTLRAKIHSVMVFDNQSPDDTAAAALDSVKKNKLQDWVKIARNKKNYGLGGTHKVIFSTAKKEGFDYVIVMHGDDQALPADIHLLLEKMPSGYDAILGARFAPGSKRQNYSLTRTLGNIGLNQLYSLATGKKIFDLGSGLNAFKVSSLDFSALERFSNDLTFNLDMLLDLIRRKNQTIYIPITWREEDQISNAKSLKIGSTALKILLNWRLGREKKAEGFSHFGFDLVA